MLWHRSTTSQTVDTTRLDPEERAALADALFGVHQSIFQGADRAAFEGCVISPVADQNLVCVYRAPSGEVVGYCSLQRRDLDLSAGPVRVLRGVMGFLPAYRRQTLAASFYLGPVARFALGAWLSGRACFGFATLVGPLMYLALARGLSELWPRVERETPPARERVLHELAQSYQLTPAPSGTPGCCAVGWVVRQGEAERRALAASPNPTLRYFLERNPGYQQGEGLPVLVPLHPLNLLSAARRGLQTRHRRRVSAEPRSTERVVRAVPQSVSSQVCEN